MQQLAASCHEVERKTPGDGGVCAHDLLRVGRPRHRQLGGEFRKLRLDRHHDVFGAEAVVYAFRLTKVVVRLRNLALAMQRAAETQTAQVRSCSPV